MSSSCINCTERVLGCHSSCERYASYKSKNEQIKSAKAKLYDNHITAKSTRNSTITNNSLAKRELYL